jgi:hypothetical protein
MVNAIVERAIRGLNQFPARDGVSDTISPLTIMTGMPGPDYNTFKIEFGSYVQVFEANDPTDTMRARNTGAIAMNPTGNTGGGYTFMSLMTHDGKRIEQNRMDRLTDARTSGEEGQSHGTCPGPAAYGTRRADF